ncbi:DUF445 domain-containing protein [Veillonella sp.]|uniref:DUF445 domain-containing protein n=1 Tax=Veillonella sp. TaxID=1926307 RepID=UPI0025F2977C|nr:DUF445 domain-containing protein [Veillonella sp.]
MNKIMNRFKGYSLYHQRANYILIGTALAYIIVFIGQFFVTESWYDAIYWCVQSALIGSIADWFAVTALFRKPLGFPYHTALIPNHKERLISGLITMVETKLLTRERCRAMLEKIQFLPIVDRYIATEEGRHSLRQLLHQGLSLGWGSKSHEEWAQWGSHKLRDFMGHRSLVPIVKSILLDLCEHNRYEQVIVQILTALQRHINDPALVSWLTSVIDEEVQNRKQGFLSHLLISFSEATDIINPQDLAESILQEGYSVLEVWKVPNSAERLAWFKQWVEPVKNLDDNKDVCLALDEAWSRWIQEQNWETIFETHICPYIDELIEKGNSQSETPAEILEYMLVDLWQRYASAPAVREHIEATLHSVVGYMLEHGYGLLGIIIREVLQGLSTEKFIEFIESKVDEDLSWIRINGALVGAVCGLVVWGLLYFIYEPLLTLLLLK